MAYIKPAIDRKQRVFFPDCVEDFVKEDNPVRFIDYFVDQLDMAKLGFQHSDSDELGHPCYDPRDLMKLYIYGYFNKIRSSRCLARECTRNVEMMWLLNRLEPDFRTISDFRKDNAEAIKNTFIELNMLLAKKSLFHNSYFSVDGSKFKAVNSKSNNFTAAKVDFQISRLHAYLDDLDKEDKKEDMADENNDDGNDGGGGDDGSRPEGRPLSKEDIMAKKKPNSLEERLDFYEGVRDYMGRENISQISLTDPESRLMKQNEGMGVCYNVQVATSSEGHFIADFEVTNRPTDHGLLAAMGMKLKEIYDLESTEVTADKGYISMNDTRKALCNGIVPHVIQTDNSTSITVDFEYEESEVAEEMLASTKPEDIEKCLKAGKIPNIYAGILSNPKIKTRPITETVPDIDDSDTVSMSEEKKKEIARQGYFVRDAESNCAYCPMGSKLYQKAEKSNGQIRYYNKFACSKCTHKCTKSKFKDADFPKDTLILKCKNWIPDDSGAGATADIDVPRKIPVKKRKVKKTFVVFTLHLDQEKMKNRKCLSEHPFGTIKRTLGFTYFLVKGKVKTAAEMALACMGYNMRRAINMLGTKELMAAMA